MPEESTFRKYTSKTKIVEKIARFELFLTVIGQLCKSDQ